MSMLSGGPHPALPQRGREIDGGLRGDALVRELERANLLGRGGAGFPVARKWRTVKANGNGRAVVLANGAEGEPLSRKDRTLMVERPHLVIDGALLAADAVRASDIIFYVGNEHRAAVSAMRRALAERHERAAQRARLVEAPAGYISGEESAAVHYINAGDARPTVTPPRPFERGIDGRPTLVQNVESLAAAALHASGALNGTALFTTSGAVRRSGVYELPPDVAPEAVVDLALDSNSLRARGLTLGCGVLYFLPADSCGVDATARIMSYLAGQSARQCGPCVFGLGAIATATRRLAERAPQAEDLARLARWSGLLAGRGACKHPDGATGLLRSALEVFADDFVAHQQRRCITRRALPDHSRVLAEAVA